MIRHRGGVFGGKNVGQAAQVPLAFGARTLYLLGGGEKEKNQFLYIVRGKKYELLLLFRRKLITSVTKVYKTFEKRQYKKQET